LTTTPTESGLHLRARALQSIARCLPMIRTIFGIDLRSLALFRVALATIVITDLGWRALDLKAHYTDFGILPRAALLGDIGVSGFSLHLMSGSAWIQGALFVVAGLLALSLLVGYRTRLSTIGSWVLLLSLQARNPGIVQGADGLLILLLFWGMLLPLGARFSVDAALDRRVQEEPDSYFSIATMALLLQSMTAYFFGALNKTHPAWIPDGTAVYYALHIDYLVTPFGIWLRQFSVLLQALTYFVWYLELLAPLLMFSPVLHVRLRLLGLTLLIGMHIGFFLCLEIGIFPFVSIASLLPFIPGQVWDRLATWSRTPERRGLAIYYDEPCEFCRKVCLILRIFLLPRETQIRPAQSDPEIYRELETHNSWVVVDRDGSHHFRWDAVALVFSRSPVFRPLGIVLASRPLRGIGERTYEAIARNRGKLGQWSAVALPYRDHPIQPTRAASVFVAVLLALMLLNNVRLLPWHRFVLPSLAREISTTLRLGQGWMMFAPAPLRVDGWYVVRGKTTTGQVVDVLRDRPGEPDWSRPTYLAREYASYRWRRFLILITNDKAEKYRPYYAQYLCRAWNESRARDQQLVELTIYFNGEIVPSESQVRQTRRLLVYEQKCQASSGPEPEGPSTGNDNF
jgi:predicted DCC family thiol-disulfide oxidoreductase YuxK